MTRSPTWRSRSANSRPASVSRAPRERQPYDVGHREAGQAHGQALGPQPGAAAGAARLFDRYGRRSSNASPPSLPSSSSGRRVQPQQLLDPAAQVGHDPGKARVVAEQHHLARAGRQRRDGLLEREAVALGDLDERLAQQPWAVAVPGADRPVEEALRLVRDHARGVDRPALAEAVAGRTGAVRAVEGERARAELGHRHVAARAREVPAQQALAAAFERDEHHARREVEGLLEPRRAGAPRRRGRRASRSTSTSMRCPRRGSSSQRLAEARGAAVHARALQPARPRRRQLLAVAALAAAGDRGGERRLPRRWPGASAARPSRRRVWAAIGSPQRGQCGRPSVANSTRRWS